MYALLKQVLLGLLKAPDGPPAPPAGAHESVQVFQASRNFLAYRLILLAIGVAVAVVGEGGGLLGMMTARDAGPALFVGFLLGMTFLGAGLSYFLIRLDYDLRYYVITDRSLRIRQGAWVIREMTVTYANIQHLEIHQGPIQRMLGISDVIIRTAGGAGPIDAEHKGLAVGHLAVLAGIENAAEMRDRINALLNRYRDAGLGDPEDRHHEAPAKGAAWSPAETGRLREIRDELRAWRRALTPPATPPAPPGS